MQKPLRLPGRGLARPLPPETAKPATQPAAVRPAGLPRPPAPKPTLPKPSLPRPPAGPVAAVSQRPRIPGPTRPGVIKPAPVKPPEIKPEPLEPTAAAGKAPASPRAAVDQQQMASKLWLTVTCDKSRFISSLVSLCGSTLPEDATERLGNCTLQVLRLLTQASQRLATRRLQANSMVLTSAKQQDRQSLLTTYIGSLVLQSSLLASLNGICELATDCEDPATVQMLTKARDIAKTTFVDYLNYLVTTYPDLVQHPEFRSRQAWYELLKAAT